MKAKLLTAVALGLICTQTYAADIQGQAVTASNQATTQEDKTKQMGDAFLEKNKKKPGVVTLSDGLQYKIIKAGKGAKPSANDTVTVEYVGKLVNGRVFDDSANHGGTVDFQVGQVIPGWTEALQLMPEGSTWEIYIPENLAYGDRGAPPAIGPNETLIFKVKLVKVQKS